MKIEARKLTKRELKEISKLFPELKDSNSK